MALSRNVIQDTIRALKENGTKEKAAKALGVSEVTIYYRINHCPEIAAACKPVVKNSEIIPEKKAPGPLPQKSGIHYADAVKNPTPDAPGPKSKPVKINIEIEAVSLQEFTDKLRGFVG